MSKYVWVHTYDCGRGKGANVTVKPFEDILESTRGYSRITQYCKIGDTSLAISQYNLEHFEEAFSQEQITLMRNAGALDYFPKGRQLREHTVYQNNRVDYKYPVFAATVYKKYGVARDPRYYLDNGIEL